MKSWICFFAALVPVFGWARPYSIDWFKVSGGGGSSTSAVYSVADTIGQPDAGGPMQGGGYQVTVGFWSLLGQQVTPPSIIAQPQNLNLTNGSSASFNVSAAGTQPLSYQWRQNGINLANNGSFLGSATSNLTVTVTGTNNAGGYSVVVTNSFGSVTSSVAMLALFYSPTIILQPTNSSAALFGTTTLNISVSGTGPFIYHWLLNGTNLLTNDIITTVAGGGVGDGGAATSGVLDSPYGAAVDSIGNIFIADTDNHRIRKVGTNGIITTVAGDGNPGYSGDGGAATNASLAYPETVAVDAVGNLFIADTLNRRIRKVDTNGLITTVAGNDGSGYSSDGSAATNVSLDSPVSVAVDAIGNLFIADRDNRRIRKVDTNGIITTAAGNGDFGYFGDGGAATNALLSNPDGVAVDGAGNLFIADSINQRIRKVNTSGIITTVAGNGAQGFNGDGIAATSANLSFPAGVIVDATGNLFIADTSNQRVRKVNTSGIITTVAGNGAQGFNGDGILATNASLSSPEGVAVDAAGNLFIADRDNRRIRKTGNNGIINTVAGNGFITGFSGDGGPATNAGLNFPEGVAEDADGNLFIVDSDNNRIRKVGTNGIITTVAGNGNPTYNGDGFAATNASLYFPSDMAVDAAGNLFIVDEFNQRIRKVGTNGIMTTLAGNSFNGYGGDGIQATNAYLNNPFGMAMDAAGNLFIADQGNSRIRKVGTNGIITTVAGRNFSGYTGDGISATNTDLNYPQGVTVDAIGNLFIADQANNRIRKVSTNGIITTVAGYGGYGYFGDGFPATNAALYSPSDVAADAAGNLFIADTFNHLIRKVSAGGIIATVAGNGAAEYNGDGLPAISASLYYPFGLMVDADGNLLVADSGNQRIRKVTFATASLLANGSLGLNNAGAASVGNYSVVITSLYGSVTSSMAAVTLVQNQITSRLLPEKRIQLGYVGVSGSNYALDQTYDLQPPIVWSPVATNAAGAGGVLIFNDTLSPGTNTFWRIRSAP